MSKVLIFANGKAKKGVMVYRALSDSEGAMIIAADGGARIALDYEMPPHSVIGDMDSLSAEELSTLANDDVQIVRHAPEKDETDLELALIYAVEQGATWIRIIGAIGGRFDQMLANVYLLALPQLADCDVALVAGKQMITLLRPGLHHLTGKPDDTISLLPISGDVQGISSRGMKYPLRDEVLAFGPARGISNVMLTAQASVTFRSGLLLCVHTDGEA